MTNIGDEAPNFDLSSTEDAVLMLCDEVPRTAVVLYFFADAEDERVRHDLMNLSAARSRLARRRAKPLAVSSLPLEQLKKLQAELQLLYPLLHDGRDFAAAYGVGSAEGLTPAPALFVIGSQQRVLWLARPLATVASALPQIEGVLRAQPSATAGYPQRVINRFIAYWVN